MSIAGQALLRRFRSPDEIMIGHAMLTRAEALTIATQAIAQINTEHEADFQAVVYEEDTVERDFVFGFFCNTREFRETRNPRHALLGIGPIIVSKRTGAVAVCGSISPYLQCIDEYEQRAAAGDW